MDFEFKALIMDFDFKALIMNFEFKAQTVIISIFSCPI